MFGILILNLEMSRQSLGLGLIFLRILKSGMFKGKLKVQGNWNLYQCSQEEEKRAVVIDVLEWHHVPVNSILIECDTASSDT